MLHATVSSAFKMLTHIPRCHLQPTSSLQSPQKQRYLISISKIFWTQLLLIPEILLAQVSYENIDLVTFILSFSWDIRSSYPTFSSFPIPMATITGARPSATHPIDEEPGHIPSLIQSHPYTCNTCQVAFRNSDLQRSHMRTDWQ